MTENIPGLEYSKKLYQCGNENDYNVVNECMSENKNKGEI